MNQVSIISDSADRNRVANSVLASQFDIKVLPLHRISETDPGAFTVIDISLASRTRFADLKAWLKRRPEGAPVLLAIDDGMSQQAMQAFAIGATDIISRPLDGTKILAKLVGELGSLGGERSRLPKDVSSGVGALQSIFAWATLGVPLDVTEIEEAGQTIVSSIEVGGLAPWISHVRTHHSQTYQHSLIVTGIAVAFANQLGFSAADQQRLSYAALMHDIGKAKIPIGILEKAGPLDLQELAVMREHPSLGHEALRDSGTVNAEVLDVVLHHHEYLDGSGYPHGLRANEISDIVRMMTIADIYGALIERRSYKPPMSAQAAYAVLTEMGPKLDMDIVRAFEPISKIQF